MADEAEDRVSREHHELAVLVAYTEDDYLRENGTDHGSAQAVADAIQAAGFTKEPELSEDELSMLRSLLRRSLAEPMLSYPGSRYRGAKSSRVLSREHPARRAKRLLLEKLGGPKVPAEPTDEEIAASEAEEERRVAELMESHRKSAELDRKLRKSEQPRRLRKDPYWRHRNRLRESRRESAEVTSPAPTDPVASPSWQDRILGPLASDPVFLDALARQQSVNGWSVIPQYLPGSEEDEQNVRWGERIDHEDLKLEYGIANMGDLNDVILEHGVERSSRDWAQSAMQPEYGDLLVARRWKGSQDEGS